LTPEHRLVKIQNRYRTLEHALKHPRIIRYEIPERRLTRRANKADQLRGPS
jgi:hypothetical protein